MTTAIGVGIVFPFALVGMMAEDKRLPVLSREEILRLAVDTIHDESGRCNRSVRIPINRWNFFQQLDVLSEWLTGKFGYNNELGLDSEIASWDHVDFNVDGFDDLTRKGIINLWISPQGMKVARYLDDVKEIKNRGEELFGPDVSSIHSHLISSIHDESNEIISRMNNDFNMMIPLPLVALSLFDISLGGIVSVIGLVALVIGSMAISTTDTNTSVKMTTQEFKDMMINQNVDDVVGYFQDLMKGEYPSWNKPWKTQSGVEVTRPVNVNGYRFKGANIFNFSGHELPIFGTKKQWYKVARSMGIELVWDEEESQYFFDVGGVSTPFWNDVDNFAVGWQPMSKTIYVDMKDDKGNVVLNPKGKPKKKKVTYIPKGEGGMTQGRPFMTWNIEATNLNWDDVISKVPNFEFTQPEPITPRDGEADIIAKLSANMAGLKVMIGISNQDSNRAYYRPSSDLVNMPPSSNFDTMESFIHTLAHEISHATGHRLRLARNLSNGFGSKSYAQEEIVAEFASFIICRSLGVTVDMPQHGKYLQGWSRTAFDGDISLDTISEADLDTMRKLLSKATQAATWCMDGLPEWFMGAKTTEGQAIPDDGIILSKEDAPHESILRGMNISMSSPLLIDALGQSEAMCNTLHEAMKTGQIDQSSYDNMNSNIARFEDSIRVEFTAKSNELIIKEQFFLQRLELAIDQSELNISKFMKNDEFLNQLKIIIPDVYYAYINELYDTVFRISSSDVIFYNKFDGLEHHHYNEEEEVEDAYAISTDIYMFGNLVTWCNPKDGGEGHIGHPNNIGNYCQYCGESFHLSVLPLVALSLDVFSFGGVISIFALVGLTMASMIPSLYNPDVTEREIHEAVETHNPDGFAWSDEQIVILNDYAHWQSEFMNGTLVTRPRQTISSVAGSGKTTIITEQQKILMRIDPSTKTFASAFNRHIAKILLSGIKMLQKLGFIGIQQIGGSNTVSAAGYDIVKSHLKGQGIDSRNIGVESSGNGKYLVLSKQIFSEYLGKINKPEPRSKYDKDGMIRVNKFMQTIVNSSDHAKPNFRNQYFAVCRDLTKLTESFMNAGFVPSRSRSQDLSRMKDIFSQISKIQGLDDSILLALPKEDLMYEMSRDVLLRSLQISFSQETTRPFQFEDYSFGDCVIPRTRDFANDTKFSTDAKYDSNNLYPLWKTSTGDEKRQTKERFKHLNDLGLVWPPSDGNQGPKKAVQQGEASCSVKVVGDKMVVGFSDGRQATKKQKLTTGGTLPMWQYLKTCHSARNSFPTWTLNHNEELIEILRKAYSSTKNGFSLNDESIGDEVIGTKIIISFSDMAWLPFALKLELSSGHYEMGFVDEIQDLSEIKGSLIRKMITDQSGLVLVGDSKQSIMQFSGSMADSMRINSELSNCINYPMTVSWRGSHAVAKQCNETMGIELTSAKETWPNHAFPNYLEHSSPTIKGWSEGDATKQIGTKDIASKVSKLRENNPDESLVILSRINAPLGKIILDLVKVGIPISTPKDEGGLLDSVKRMMTRKHAPPTNANMALGIDFDNANFTSFYSIISRIETVEAWAFSQSLTRNKGDATAAKNDDKFISIIDDCDLTKALYSLFFESNKNSNNEIKYGTKVKDFMKWCNDDLFASGGDNPVVLSSIHKFKGGEADRAIILRSVEDSESEECRQIFMHKSKSDAEENMVAELSILYVAYTRAKIQTIEAWAELNNPDSDDDSDSENRCIECDKTVDPEFHASCSECHGVLCNENVPERGPEGGKMTQGGSFSEVISCGEFVPIDFDDLFGPNADSIRKAKEDIRQCKECYDILFERAKNRQEINETQ